MTKTTKKYLYMTAATGLVGLGSLSFGIRPANAQTAPTEPSAAGDGLLTGNAVVAPITAPVLVCANSIAGGVLGTASADGSCGDTTSTPSTTTTTTPPADTPAAQPTASGDGAVSGNAVAAPVSVPVVVCGNTVAGGVVGSGSASGDCGNAAAATTQPAGAQPTASGDGLASGNAVAAPVSVPVVVCGNTVAGGVVGSGSASGDCGDVAAAALQPRALLTRAEGSGLLTGNALTAPVSLPIVVCGNDVAVAGLGSGTTSGTCGAPPSGAPAPTTPPGPGPAPGGPSTPGNETPSVPGGPAPGMDLDQGRRPRPDNIRPGAAPAPSEAAAASAAGPAGPGAARRDSLPDTGGPLAGLTALGVALLATGAGLRAAEQLRIRRIR